jgi:hypothetical protein
MTLRENYNISFLWDEGVTKWTTEDPDPKLIASLLLHIYTSQ